MSSPEMPPSRVDTTGESLGDLLNELTGDLSKLMRQELELAKAELREEASKAGKATGMLAAAGFAGYLTTVLLSFALVFALGAVMPLGWAALIVAALWGIAGAVLYTSGRAKLRTVNPKPERTVATLKEDAEWAKHPTK
ncbi:phage holin family protein [Lentzea sp. DG1S-22]|uniref:phage holin family protein n=1 Tax=Lentzea sp. DG1S-22 TaxID=3108822 RepID=UPI002E79BF3A|nr:phage holin family protein [Lentzea sp. DG1S-22]WVH83145.1 phage holin family protein [Lentzea sp. DG1S-22]